MMQACEAMGQDGGREERREGGRSVMTVHDIDLGMVAAVTAGAGAAGRA